MRSGPVRIGKEWCDEVRSGPVAEKVRSGEMRGGQVLSGKVRSGVMR